MDYNSATRQRFKELRPGPDGKLMTEWQLTDTRLLDTVKLTLPPPHAIPIIFVPGIMGSNLADLNNEPVWLLNSIRNVPVKLAWNWSPRNAGERQKILHPARTKVFSEGAVPKENIALGLTMQDFLLRGWGEVSEASYHGFLVWIDTKMNASRDPLRWSDFSQSSPKVPTDPLAYLKKTLPAGITMIMKGLPDFAEAGHKVEAIKSDDLLKRSKSIYPVYAFGYNWLDTNVAAAKLLKARIEKVIGENNKGPMRCTQVILVTHSMGGLVARACSQLPEVDHKIVGIVHGVMPATGAAVAYRRCKVGMKDENPGAGLVIGSDGKEVTAVFAQSPGALQLLPSKDYGANWLRIADPSGKIVLSLPQADPYSEIYLQRDQWWSLIREEWLSPIGGKAIEWKDFSANIIDARNFHAGLAGKYHPNTFSFFGGGSDKKSFENIVWEMKRGIFPENKSTVPTAEETKNMRYRDVRTDGSNNLYVGGNSRVSTSTRGDSSTVHFHEFSYWEIRCAQWNSTGDGTVPILSGIKPRIAGGSNIIQQFELAGVEHEPAFRDYPISKIVTYYAITKLAALADRS
jgi:hypothetical protein